MSLASDDYISSFYKSIFGMSFNGQWSSHGNGGRFQNSIISGMQMDNICFNHAQGHLIANELKLGGGKNHDQILKYAKLFNLLRDKQLVSASTHFSLLFISDVQGANNWQAEIDAEVLWAKKSKKPSSAQLLTPDIISTANHMHKNSITWHDVLVFNDNWLSTLGPTQSVEKKLLWGFNQSLSEKYHIRLAISA